MPEMQAGRFGVGSDEGGLELLEEHTGGCRSDFVLDDDMRLDFWWSCGVRYAVNASVRRQ